MIRPRLLGRRAARDAAADSVILESRKQAAAFAIGMAVQVSPNADGSGMRIGCAMVTGANPELGVVSLESMHSIPSFTDGDYLFEAPDLPAFTYFGAVRLYFNRHSAAPRVWCVSPDVGDDSWELALVAVDFNGVPAMTSYVGARLPGAEKPSAWIVVTGTLKVFHDGTARIETA